MPSFRAPLRTPGAPARCLAPVLALLALLFAALPASAQTLGTRSIQFGAPVDDAGNVLLTARPPT